MSKAAVKISADLLSNPLCEQDQAFLDSMTALDTSMRRMDAFNQEKVRPVPTVDFSVCLFHSFCCLPRALFPWHLPLAQIPLDWCRGKCLSSDIQSRKLDEFLLEMRVLIFVNIVQPVD